MDLIERAAAIEIIQSMYPGMPRVPWMRKDWQKRYEPYIRTENAIRELPSVQPDRGYIEQIKWERDLAIQQLADLGYSLGEKPRMSGDTISRQAVIDMIRNHWSDFSNADDYRTARDCVDAVPSAQSETANIIVGKSRNGMTMWYQCDNCNEPVDENDLYCRGCGRRFEHGSDR